MGNSAAKELQLDAFRKAILGVIEDHWKEEWKIAVRQVVEQIDIDIASLQFPSPWQENDNHTSNAASNGNNESKRKCFKRSDNNDIKYDNSVKAIRRVRFRNVPGLELDILKRGSEQMEFCSSGPLWTFPQVKTMGDYKHSTATAVRQCLGLNGPVNWLPYNLWCQVFDRIHTFCKVGALVAPYATDRVDEKFIMERQYYVFPQHYSTFVYRGVPHDRGWIRFDRALAGQIENFPFDRHSELWKPWGSNRHFSPPNARFINRLQEFIIRSQTDGIVQALFRHDPTKQELAYQIAEIIGLDYAKFSYSLVGRRNNASYELKLQAVKPTIQWTNMDGVDVPVCSSLEQVSVVPVGLTDGLSNGEMREVELSLLSYFDPYELGTLFQWITQICSDYATLFARLKSDFNFPSPDDHFSNPKQLRGKLADTHFVKSMSVFKQLVATADNALDQLSLAPPLSQQTSALPIFQQSSALSTLLQFTLSSSEQLSMMSTGVKLTTVGESCQQHCKNTKKWQLPTVLCTLITDYLPFPPPPCTL